MKKSISKWLLGIAAVMFAIALAACSGNTPEPAGSEGGDNPYNLVKPGVLIVASDLDFAPFDSFEDSVAQGFDVDLSTEIAHRLGLEVEYLPPQNFDSIIPMIVQGGKADIGNSAFTITDERLQEIDFTDPYIDSNLGVCAKIGSGIETEEDLNSADVTIAVQAGTTGEFWAREHYPEATIVPLNTITECMAGLSTGLYNAVCSDIPVIAHQCTVSFTDCAVIVEIPTGDQFGIVVSKDNPELTAAINEVLAEMEADGTMDALKEKWFGDSI